MVVMRMNNWIKRIVVVGIILMPIGLLQAHAEKDPNKKDSKVVAALDSDSDSTRKDPESKVSKSDDAKPEKDDDAAKDNESPEVKDDDTEPAEMHDDPNPSVVIDSDDDFLSPLFTGPDEIPPFEEMITHEAIPLPDYYMNESLRDMVEHLVTQLRAGCSEDFYTFLLVGPQHAGKKTLAASIATQAGYDFQLVDVKVLVAWVEGKGVSFIDKLFGTIRNLENPTIVYFDGLDQLIRVDEDKYRDLYKLFWNEIKDAVRINSNLFFMTSAPRAKALNPYLASQFIGSSLSLNLPDQGCRQYIIEQTAKKMGKTIAPEVSKEYASLTHEWSAKDLQCMVKKTSSFLFRRIEEPGDGITKEQLHRSYEALKRIKYVHAPSSVGLKDLYLSDKESEKVAKVIKVLRKTRHNKADGRTLILYGPPGVGKTTLARAIANESGHEFMPFVAANFVTRYQGSGSEKIKKIFTEAKAKRCPVVIFIDELEAIAPSKEVNNRTISYQNTARTLWTELDDCKYNHPNIFIIAAVNDYKSLDKRIQGRFRKFLKLDLPEKEARKKIIAIQARQFDKIIPESLCATFAGKTKGWSGRNLSEMVQEAASMTHAVGITSDALYKAYEQINEARKAAQDSFYTRHKTFIKGTAHFVATTAGSYVLHLALNKAKKMYDERNRSYKKEGLELVKATIRERLVPLAVMWASQRVLLSADSTIKYLRYLFDFAAFARV